VAYPLTAIISDLHANMPAIETAVADAVARGAERFHCLGDMVGYGAEPLQAVRRVRELVAGRGATRPLAPGLCLKGNHEAALIDSEQDSDFNPKARAAIRWTKEALGVEGFEPFDWIDSLSPEGLDESAMWAHGSPRDPLREYMLPRDRANADKMRACFAALRAKERLVCFVGHSHVPAIYFEDGRMYRPTGTTTPLDLGLSESCRAILNVGSVGQPRDGDPRLSYVLWDGKRPSFIRLDYDHQAAAERIRAVKDLPEFLADRLLVGR
jgi:diadenosine tetraphosphatase ApaH/serine/threonine PP2A family protein phosphatase